MTKDKKVQNRTKFKLMSYHHEAVELRYQGNKHSDIALLLQAKYKKNFADKKVRTWFALNGILEKEYLDYAKKENDRRRQVVVEEMKKLTLKIPVIFQEILEERIDPKTNNKIRDMVTVSALKNLCELLGFKIVEGTGSDPLDDYFDRAEEEIKKKDA